MITKPCDNADAAGDINDVAYQRMLAARDEVRRTFFSKEARANEFPADAPEVIGMYSPEIMREARQRRVAR